MKLEYDFIVDNPSGRYVFYVTEGPKSKLYSVDAELAHFDVKTVFDNICSLVNDFEANN